MSLIVKELALQSASNVMGGSTTIRLAELSITEEQESKVEPRNSENLVPELSDEALMAEVCLGSGEALGQLFCRYARAVRGVAYRVLRDVSEADDLLQDVFLLINRLCKTFDGSKAPAKFWILQMAYRRAISRRRSLTSRHFYTRLDPEDVANELPDSRSSARQIDASIDERLGNGSLQQVIATLSENQRQTLLLFFTEGYTLDEIATKLGQSRANVKHHYFRGLDRLRRELFGGKVRGERAI